MSLSNNFPTIRPSLLLDFANTKRLDPRITFTRAATAVYYDGVTTAKAEENLLTYSEQFNNAAWGGSSITITTDATVAPNGTTTADKLIGNTATGTHYRQQATAFNSGQQYTYSVFAKASEYSAIQLGWSTSLSTEYANFNLSTGVISAGTYTGASITSVGNGWYRCSITSSALTTSTTLAGLLIAITSATDVRLPSFTGDNTSGVFIWGAQLEQRSSVTVYTPTTTQAITNYIPVLQTAASGAARFDHNPTTGESLGLLIEEARTNLLTYSEQFDNAAWTKTRSSITANTIVAPDGTLTGDKLVEDTTATNSHLIFGTNVTFVNGSSYSMTIYAKSAERSVLQLTVGAGVGGATRWANFDLSTGLIGSKGVDATSSISSVGNGWYRCQFGFAATAAGVENVNAVLCTSATDSRLPSYTGNGYSGIYIWGAQLEAGAFATSYIPTVASQVTRAADVATMTGTNFSSWYRADEGTFYSESQWTTTSARNNSPLFRVDDGTNNNYLQLHFRNVSPTAPASITVRVSGGSEIQPTSPTVATNDGLPHKFAGAYTAAQLRFSADNQTAGTATPSSLPVVNTARIGAANTGVPSLYAIYIRKLSYYPKALTAAELQALTA